MIETTEGQPRRASIKGWLLVLSRVLLIWEPLEFAVAAFGAYNAVAVRGWPVIAVLLARLAGTVLSVAAGRGLSNGHAGAPAVATAALALIGTTRVFALLTPYFPSNAQPGQVWAYLMLIVVYYGGGIAYLARSAQVRALRTA